MNDPISGDGKQSNVAFLTKQNNRSDSGDNSFSARTLADIPFVGDSDEETQPSEITNRQLLFDLSERLLMHTDSVRDKLEELTEDKDTQTRNTLRRRLNTVLTSLQEGIFREMITRGKISGYRMQIENNDPQIIDAIRLILIRSDTPSSEQSETDPNGNKRTITPTRIPELFFETSVLENNENAYALVGEDNVNLTNLEQGQ